MCRFDTKEHERIIGSKLEGAWGLQATLPKLNIAEAQRMPACSEIICANVSAILIWAIALEVCRASAVLCPYL